MQGAPDLYSCHAYVIPDSVPDEREFVGVRVGLDGASHLHHILLMECPGEPALLCWCQQPSKTLVTDFEAHTSASLVVHSRKLHTWGRAQLESELLPAAAAVACTCCCCQVTCGS